jgi:hypothetical protein
MVSFILHLPALRNETIKITKHNLRVSKAAKKQRLNKQANNKDDRKVMFKLSSTKTQSIIILILIDCVGEVVICSMIRLIIYNLSCIIYFSFFSSFRFSLKIFLTTAFLGVIQLLLSILAFKLSLLFRVLLLFISFILFRLVSLTISLAFLKSIDLSYPLIVQLFLFQ